MSCRKITRWVLRNGMAEIPAAWQSHIAECAECRRVIDDVQALDTALTRSEVPDPGEAYWEGFAPSVARRLEALSDTSKKSLAVPVRRWAWVRLWAPAAGVAVLALLLGRELTRDYATTPVILDSDVLIQSESPQETVIAPEAKEAGAATLDIADPVVADRTADLQPSPVKPSPETTGPTMRAAVGVSEEVTPDVLGGAADAANPTVDHVAGRGSIPEPGNSADFDQEDDSSVWPDRQVLTLGQVGGDASERPTMDDNRLSEQDSPGLSERRTMWAESSGTPSAQARLEGTRTFRSAALPDSQSPTEAMRRFDELIELRQQIAKLEKLKSDDLTHVQTRELCAMWYRTGQITVDPVELDTAIDRMGKYIDAMDSSLREEWHNKKSQLVARRALL